MTVALHWTKAVDHWNCDQKEEVLNGNHFTKSLECISFTIMCSSLTTLTFANPVAACQFAVNRARITPIVWRITKIMTRTSPEI